MVSIWESDVRETNASGLAAAVCSSSTLPSHSCTDSHYLTSDPPLELPSSSSSHGPRQSCSWSSSSPTPPFVGENSACLDLITKLRRCDSLLRSSGVSFWFLLRYYFSHMQLKINLFSFSSALSTQPELCRGDERTGKVTSVSESAELDFK